MELRELKSGMVLDNSQITKIFLCSSQGGMRRSLRTGSLECVSKIISSKKSCKQNMNSRQNDKTIEALGQLIKTHSNAAELLYL